MSRYRWFALAVLLLGLAMGAWLRHEFQRLSDAPASATVTTQQVMVAPGSSVAAVGRQLQATGAIAAATDLTLAYRIWGAGVPIQAGEYAIAPGASVRDLLRLLQSGATVQHALTIVEGMTVRELRARLRAEPALLHTLDPISDADLLAALGLPAGHPEGRFLPDTYRFPRGTTDRDFLRRANAALDHALVEAWADRAAKLPLASAAELLTLASVVEKETGLAAERALIAGVFVRRLQKGMRLQTDPTVIYGLGVRFDGNLRKQDLMTDGPYNTYTRRGLPPTPICLPGREALRAAARPAAGDALYFVANGDGGHVFSATLEQHNAAVRRYLDTLRARRRGGRAP